MISAETKADIRRLSLEDRLRLDELCLRFEDSLKSGPHRAELVFETMKSVDGDYFRACLLYEILRIEFHRVDPEQRAVLRRRHSEAFPELREIVELAWMIEDPLDLTAGWPVADYTILRRIGAGGFGAVYLASDVNHRQVVLKLIAVDLPDCEASGHYGIDEVNALQRLRHPRIVPLLDFGVYAPPDMSDRTQIHYIVMPWYSHGTLETELRSAESTIDRSVAVSVQIAEALSYAHALGIVHGDVKPANLLLRDDHSIVLADFGLAQNTELQAGRTSEISGSLRYMSPEQLRGETRWFDGRSDIWSVGVILYRMLTGTLPFDETTVEGLSEAIQRRPPRPVRQVRPDVPEQLETVCLRCLQPKPQDRFPTAGALREALIRVQEECLPQLESPAAVPGRRNAVPRARKHFITLAAFCFVGGLLAAFLLRGTDQRKQLNSLVERYGSHGLRVRSPVAELKNGQEVSLPIGKDKLDLEMSVDFRSYLYAFSVQQDGVIRLLPRTEEPLLCNPQEWCRIGPYETELSKTDEFLVFIASSQPLNYAESATLLDDLETAPQTARRLRGIKVPSKPMDASVMYIPYRVVADETLSDGDQHSHSH